MKLRSLRMMLEQIEYSQWWLKYAISAALLGLSLLLWYMFLYYPLYERKLALYARLQGYQAAPLPEPSSASSSLPQEQTQALERYIMGKKPSIWMHEHLVTILAHIYASGLIVTSCSVDDPLSKAWCTKFLLHFHMQGTLDQLEQFLEKMSTLPALYQSKKISIVLMQDKKYAIDMALALYGMSRKKM